MTEIQAVQTADGSWTFDAAVVASAIPVRPPRSWFDDPQLTEPTALTVTADGRVYGHACAWGVRHIGLPGHRTAPRSKTDYRYYRTAQVETDDGGLVATGRITMGAGHADLNGDLVAASEHYDNVCAAVADVACGEDQHGLWVAGALRPEVTPEQIRTLRASSVSGDWRGVGSGLELCGILAVNVPGFSVPRAGLAASGQQVTALVAAGVVASSTWDESKHPRGTGDQGGQWIPRDEAGKQAQGDKRSQDLYGQLEGLDGAKAKAMLGKLNDDELRKLTEFAYSSKTSDPKIVAARNAVASEMGRRGMDIKKHGAKGGGAKGATRASAGVEAVVSAPVSGPVDGPSPDGTVSIGDTGLVGRVVESTESGDVVVEVTVSADMVHAASEEQAVAASAKLTHRQEMRSLRASVTGLSEQLAARDRADAAARLLEGVPNGS